MWTPSSEVVLFIRHLTADKHLLKSLFANITLSTEGVWSCLAFVIDNYTGADNMWTHFQCLSVAPVSIRPFLLFPLIHHLCHISIAFST